MVNGVDGTGQFLASYKFQFIRVHDNLVKDPSYDESTHVLKVFQNH